MGADAIHSTTHQHSLPLSTTVVENSTPNMTHKFTNCLVKQGVENCKSQLARSYKKISFTEFLQNNKLCLLYLWIKLKEQKPIYSKFSKYLNHMLKNIKCGVLSCKRTCSWNVRASLELLNVDSTTDCIFSMMTSWFKRLTCM